MNDILFGNNNGKILKKISKSFFEIRQKLYCCSGDYAFNFAVYQLIYNSYQFTIFYSR